MQFEMSVGTDYSTVTFKTFGHANMKIVFERLGGKMTDNSYLNWLFPSFITSEVIQEVIHNTCFVCGGLMKDGTAIQNGKILVSSYDSAVDTYEGEIEYPDANNHFVIKVRKCTSCGHSHT